MQVPLLLATPPRNCVSLIFVLVVAAVPFEQSQFYTLICDGTP